QRPLRADAQPAALPRLSPGPALERPRALLPAARGHHPPLLRPLPHPRGPPADHLRTPPAWPVPHHRLAFDEGSSSRRAPSPPGGPMNSVAEEAPPVLHPLVELLQREFSGAALDRLLELEGDTV